MDSAPVTPAANRVTAFAGHNGVSLVNGSVMASGNTTPSSLTNNDKDVTVSSTENNGGIGVAGSGLESGDATPNSNDNKNGGNNSNNNNNNSNHVSANGGGSNVNRVVETPKGPPLARVATAVPGVHVAQYSNVDVLELDIGANTVMRRVSDGSVNATQILKVAGLDRSRRQKALERDIGPRFEIIQGGTGKYQGTWIPLDDAVSLARTYNVFELLQPLFDFDMAHRPQIRPLTQMEIDVRRRELAQQNSQQGGSNSNNNTNNINNNKNNNTGGGAALTPSAVAAAAAAAASVPRQPPTGNDVTPLHEDQTMTDQSMAADQSMTDQQVADQSMTDQSIHASMQHQHQQHQQSIASGMGGDQSMMGGSLAPPLSAKPETSVSTTVDQPADDLSTFPPLEPREGDALAELSREVVTELFLSANRGDTKPLSEILRANGASEIEPDVPIDDAGHTALHWAAALGKVPLVADLVNHGANCRRGNRKGESPLIRAVLVTNSSDNQTFGDLLDLLFPCLHLGDSQGRTVLHHIALTAGIPGRSEASRYYLDALFEWAVRCRGASGVKWLVDELVDAQDANGDTALNIAARLGSKRIAQQLVEIGADVELPNRAGLKPADFGIVPTGGVGSKGGTTSGNNTNHNNLAGHNRGASASSASAAAVAAAAAAAAAGGLPPLPAGLGQPCLSSDYSGNNTKTHTRSSSRAPMDGGERRNELHMRSAAALRDFDEQLSQELASKDRTLQAVHARLKEASETLEQLLKRKDSLEQIQQRHEHAKQRIAALERAAAAENERFNSDSAQNFSTSQIPDTHFDADEPFRVTSVSELRQLPPVLLRARIAAYKRNEQQLIQLRNELRTSSLEGEAKFRKVVAQCTSSDEGKVDEMLEDLLAAVAKNDAPNRLGEKMEVEA